MSGVLDNSTNGRKSLPSSPGGVKRAFLALNDKNKNSENSQQIYKLFETLKERYFFQPENIIFLTADEAGEEQILAAMETLIQLVNHKDTVVIRFSDEKILDDARVSDNLNTLSKLSPKCII
ncbi:hypothetical protein [Nostoc sp. TCL26-01]|uniref:hypothetical protein n=1 Tax=Nostoc sp. TCL26-01 TaxID=2576904 RepID=UPI0015B9DDCF|nr:hypothetical protein [Nostoc sp. TCL26-01]QLE60022.1 hypothetical protein FD725_31935 [Nostoc sp. TCL26-01]